jgi:uncharacterized membrane protein YecN with MAPEG domain
MYVTALYAGLLVPLYILLSARVIGQRRAQRVEIGDAGDKELLRRMRVHANFIEYTPYCLLLMALAESLKTPVLAVHALGLLLLVGRGLHAYALSQTPHVMQMRVFGMVLTLTALAMGGVACIVGAVLGGALRL